MTASNSVGTGLASAASSPVTPATVPGVPTAVLASLGNAEVSIRWTAPTDNGGAAITGYTVTTVEDHSKTCTAVAPATTCTVTGLTNGTAYIFTVTATNDVGTGQASDASDAVTPVTVPAAPSAVYAVADNATAMVHWTAPASDGGAPISSYTVTSSPGGKVCTAGALAFSCDVTGLTNGTAYSFSVTATNRMGEGPASTASAVVTPGLPGTPGTPVGVAGDGVVSLSWTQPVNGGDPTEYTAFATPGGQSCTIKYPGRAFPTAGCKVTGLVNGESYHFEVRADNVVGSTYSAQSDPIQPIATTINGVCGSAADTPTLLKPSGFLCSAGQPSTVASGQGTFTWSCQGSGGGTTAACSVAGAQNSAGGTTTFVTPDVGEGGCTLQQASVLSSPNLGPDGVDMPYGLVAFESGLCQGASTPVAEVKLTYSQTIEGLPFFKWINNQWVELTADNSGLRISGNTATFRIEDNGPFDSNPVAGLISDPAGPGVNQLPPVPGEPLAPTASAGNTTATVSWQAPSTGGAPVSYTVSATPGGRQCTVPAAQTTCTVTGLTNGTGYTFTVVAGNAGGTGTPSAPSNAVTPMAPDNRTAEGVCGPASGVASMQAPATGLCTLGEPSAVLAASGGFNWSCQPVGTATAAQCRAPGASIPGGAGTVSFELLPGSGCEVEEAQLSPPSVSSPQGGDVPFGLASFKLKNCTAQAATVNLTFSEPVAGMTLWKWMRQTWTTVPAAVLSGNTARFTIQDNGPYDANPLPGVMWDPVGPGRGNGKASQPVLKLNARKTTVKSGQFAVLKVSGGKGKGKISLSAQSNDGATCKVRTLGSTRWVIAKGKTSGASCSVWAIKAGDKAWNATVSNSVTVRVTATGK